MVSTSNENGRHFSGYYVQPASTGRHGNGSIIIDVDETLYDNVATIGKHANRFRANLITGAMFIISAFIGILIALIPMMFIGLYRIPSQSMMDTLQPGDRIVISRMWMHDDNVNRGDIIVFHDPGEWLDAGREGETLIKRVIGLPGDTVSSLGDCKVLVNGEIIDEPYVKDGCSSNIAFNVTVPSGKVFVMGDNRGNSADSRYHLNDANGGMVPIGNIIGKTEGVFWPLHDMRFNIRNESSDDLWFNE